MSITISGTGAVTGVSTNYSFDKKVSIGGSVGIGTTVLDVNGDIKMHRAGGGGTRALNIGDGSTDGRGLVVSNFDRSNANVNLLGLIGRWNHNQVASILFQTGSDTVNKKDGSIIFRTRDGQAGGIPTRMTLTSEGNIGIGTSTPAERLTVEGSVKVQNSSNASEYLTINYQGLNFQNTGAGSSTTSSAHLLDDYEEGTWTPEIFDILGGSASATYSTQDGHYTKIGNAVTVTGIVDLSSASGSGSAIGVRGLPFVSGSNVARSSGPIGNAQSFQGEYPTHVLTSNSGDAFLQLRSNDRTVASSNTDASNLTNSTRFDFTVTYFID